MAIQVKVALKHRRHYGNWERCIAAPEQRCIYLREVNCALCEGGRLVYDSGTEERTMKMLGKAYR